MRAGGPRTLHRMQTDIVEGAIVLGVGHRELMVWSTTALEHGRG